jgi:hypothetical protein
MRALTVSTLHRPRRHDYARTAQIRLAGRWLESAGFPRGSRVVVQVQQGQLVISLLP